MHPGDRGCALHEREPCRPSGRGSRIPAMKKPPPENREAKKKSREDSVLVFRRGFGGLGGAGRLLHAGVRTRKHGSG